MMFNHVNLEQESIKPMTTTLIFTVPLTQQQRQVATSCSQRYSDSVKANRIYRQVLALYAVRFYTDCMGITTDLTASGLCNPIEQLLSDVAELPIPGLPGLECVLVEPAIANLDIIHHHPQTLTVQTSPEALDNRLGYVAVGFSPTQEEAYLLGFRKTLSLERTTLDNWQSLDWLFIALKNALTPTSFICLRDWFDEQFTPDWEPLSEEFIRQDTGQVPAIAFRTPSTEPIIQRAKRLQFSDGHTIALEVGVYPLSDQEIDIRVRLIPPLGAALPSDLSLMILDEMDTIVMQTQARGSSVLRLEFSVEPEEIFKLKLQRNTVSLVETFSF
jgi:hypothetical protein